MREKREEMTHCRTTEGMWRVKNPFKMSGVFWGWLRYFSISGRNSAARADGWQTDHTDAKTACGSSQQWLAPRKTLLSGILPLRIKQSIHQRCPCREHAWRRIQGTPWVTRTKVLSAQKASEDFTNTTAFVRNHHTTSSLETQRKTSSSKSPAVWQEAAASCVCREGVLWLLSQLGSAGNTLVLDG